MTGLQRNRLVLSRLNNVTESGNGWKALCPAHDDHKPSLDINVGDDGRVLLCCRSKGCSAEAICKAIDLSMADLFVPRRNGRKKENQSFDTFGELIYAFGKSKRGRGRNLTHHLYHDHDGTAVGIVIVGRKPGKDKEVTQGALIDGRWRFKGMSNPPLYRLPDLLNPQVTHVIVVEGEKCAELFRRLTHSRPHVAVTTSLQGAKSPQKTDWSPLAGKKCCIVPDNDEAGEKYAADVAGILLRLDPAPEVKIVRLPLENEGDDIEQWLDRYGPRAEPSIIFEDFAKIAMVVKPVTMDDVPAVEESQSAEMQQPGDGHDFKMLTNAKSVMGEEGHVDFPLTMAEILADVETITGGELRRVASSLFVPSTDGVNWLDSPDALMGWIGAQSTKPPRFVKTAGFHTRGEVFSELRRTAPAFEAVELVPHEPPIAGHYYAGGIPTAGNGEHLRWLLDRFCPATDIDRDLLQAALMTPFWGGAGGTRPAFLMTADEGRGRGKSKFVQMVAEVVGGYVDVDAKEDAGMVRTRLLSAEGMTKRVVLLDNVKSLRFSWAELEAMITASIISGKRNYCGEGQRPNTITWFITLNGASLSTDLSQRCIIIKLATPAFAPLWEEHTRAYIREHRQELIGDIIAALRTERTPLTTYSRWGAWERDVLSRLPEPSDAQVVIAERQKVADVENEESAIIEDAFKSRLKELHYDTDTERIHIPSTLAAKWLGEILNDRITTTASTRKIGQLIDENVLKRIKRNPCNTNGRGFLWVGEQFDPDSTVRLDIEHLIEQQRLSRQWPRT